MVAAAHHGVAHVGVLGVGRLLGLAGAVRVVVVHVIDGLGAAGGGADHDRVGEAGGGGALLLGELVRLAALGACGVAVVLEGHGRGRVAAGGDLEHGGVEVRRAADVALVVLGVLDVVVGAVAGGVVVGRVLGEDVDGVAERVGRRVGADDLHALSVAERRSGAHSGGELVERAATDLALVVLTLDHGDVASTASDAVGRHGVDDGDGDDEEGNKNGENLGHFLF